MRMSLAFTFLAVVTTAAAADWMPPEKPDPEAILNEARADKRARRYEDATAKFVWFHEHALEYTPSLSGVRLSFALSDWKELADVYPPAWKKMQEARDQARRGAQQKHAKAARRLFRDFACLNETLEDYHETVNLFRELDKQNAPLAKQVFEDAMPALLKHHDYPLCMKYIEPEKDFDSYCERFQKGRQPDPTQIAFAEKKFNNQVTILVALLVVSDRKLEAEVFAQKAKEIWENKDFAKAVDKALRGNVPSAWP